MRLPTLEHKAHLIDEEKAQAMVDYAIRNGVNYFDTAYVYHSEVPFQAGMSELFLGRALKNHRPNVHLATKLPSWFVQSRADMDRFLDEQLQRLQTHYIDFYLLHSLTEELWAKLSRLGVTEFLDAAIADGRIKHAGFSFHDAAPLFRSIVDAYDWSFCQIQYNFMDEDYQAGRAAWNMRPARAWGWSSWSHCAAGDWPRESRQRCKRCGTRAGLNGQPRNGRCGLSGTGRRRVWCSAE